MPINLKFIFGSVVTILIVSGFVYWQYSKTPGDNIKKTSIDLQQSTAGGDQKKIISSSDILSSDPLEENLPIDCGSDFDCFINNTVSCKESSVKRILNFDLFGTPVTINESYILKGWINGKCLLSFRIESLAVIATQECSFDETKPLTASLEAWKNGNIAGTGWDSCEIVDIQHLTPDITTVTPEESLPAIELSDFPVEENLSDGWQITSDEISLRSENYDRYNENEGLVAERTVVISSGNDTSVILNIVEFDSASNAEVLFDEGDFTYTHNIIIAECRAKASKHTTSCLRGFNKNYYLQTSVQSYIGDFISTDESQKEWNNTSKFISALLRFIP